MDKIARQVVLGFILFLVITYVCCMHEYERFLVCLMKGALVDIIIVPLMHLHYNDPKKYKFKAL